MPKITLLVVVVDTSGSMKALDFKIEGENTDRLSIVKQVLKEQLGVNWANYGISHHQNIPRETTPEQSTSRRRRPPRV